MRERSSFGQFDDDNDDQWNESPYGQRGSYSRQPHAGATSQHFETGSRDVRFPCPACQSPRIEPRHVARRIGGAVGAAAGATSAIGIALSGAEAGAAAGLLAGPIGSACGGIAGAILAGLVAGAAGCATGAACGEAIDQKVLNNWRCLACGRTFTLGPR
ncbi:hypothetical protein [Burkholderia reimsis]|uniref:hypothetical protein n=1 Tax=Burkholderia reimsis TaxID=2234132 RepID=UPI001FCAC80E|nr:hypothetical protein [Burkholderia reimsis]